MSDMDESTFIERVGKMLDRMADAIEDADTDGLIDVECSDGVLTLVLEDGRTFVVNRHLPMRQVWLSSPLSGAYHFDWDQETQQWAITSSGEELMPLLQKEIAQAVRVQVEW